MTEARLGFALTTASINTAQVVPLSREMHVCMGACTSPQTVAALSTATSAQAHRCDRHTAGSGIGSSCCVVECRLLRRCCQNNAPHVGGSAAVVGTHVQGARPHFFVGHAVIANNSRLLKVMLQCFDVAESRGFEIKNDGKGLMLCRGIAKFVHRLGNVYTME